MVQIILAARGRITTHFGQNIGRGFPHRGIDQGHSNGTAADLEIRAPADGVVTYAARFGSYGLCIFIRHDDGWISVLAHHRRHLVSKGDRVAQGQIIAVMGNSGTKYVHSHEELRDANGNQLDPLLHLVTSATASSTQTKLGGFLMALSDAEQDELLMRTRAVYDALFTEDATSRGGRAGVLRTVARIDDALFLGRTTSFGTPGGVLVTLRKVTDNLGITKP